MNETYKSTALQDFLDEQAPNYGTPVVDLRFDREFAPIQEEHEPYDGDYNSLRKLYDISPQSHHNPIVEENAEYCKSDLERIAAPPSARMKTEMCYVGYFTNVGYSTDFETQTEFLPDKGGLFYV